MTSTSREQKVREMCQAYARAAYELEKINPTERELLGMEAALSKLEHLVEPDDESRKMSYRGVDVTITKSGGSDGAVVIFVDTDAERIPDGRLGPEVRIMLNDGDVFVGKPYEPLE